jgi:uncharacterized membrane protein YdjX (TVP38/TMEM64 family)
VLLTVQVPFSASNYLLGLTPVQLPAFLGGTLLGMSVWSTVYASLGGASRVLLDGGEDLGTLISGRGHFNHCTGTAQAHLVGQGHFSGSECS